jgi:hypothetical protein
MSVSYDFISLALLMKASDASLMYSNSQIPIPSRIRHKGENDNSSPPSSIAVSYPEAAPFRFPNECCGYLDESKNACLPTWLPKPSERQPGV